MVQEAEHLAGLELIEETPVRWRIERREPMRVPGIVFGSGALLPRAASEQVLQ